VLGRFYIRRVLRIFPLYYFIVLGGILVGVPAAREAWPWLLTYTSNFYEALQQRPVGYYGHFWTLAVEEQFYLVWPWLVLFAPRRWLAAIILAAVLVAPLYRDLAVDVLKEDGWGTLPFGCLDTLGVGALLAIAFRDARSPQAVYASAGAPRSCRSVCCCSLALHWIALRTGNLRPLVAFHEIAYAMVCCWLIAGAYRGFGGLRGPSARVTPGRVPGQDQLRHLCLPHADAVVPHAHLRTDRLGIPRPRTGAPGDRERGHRGGGHGLLALLRTADQRSQAFRAIPAPEPRQRQSRRFS
jgi:peptidoglycan/LPS O-acetylase OafA/YrhL